MRQTFSALAATAQLVRTGRTLLRSVRIRQKTGAAPELYIQFFNNAAPTVGTTAPNMVIPVPAGAAGEIKLDNIDFQGIYGGRDFGTALSIACTTVHDGAVAPTAGDEPVVDVDYNAVGA